MTRRECLQLVLAAAAPAGSERHFRFSVCNETFESTSFEEQCGLAREIGYEGIEMMAGTLADNPISIPPVRRKELRRVIGDQGLSFVGLHNLLTVPQGMRASARDARVRRRTWDFVSGLVDLCSDLGSNGILVFGSGKQRDAEPGDATSDALARFRDGLRSVAPHALEAGVTILIEPLAPRLSNLLNRLDETVELVRQIESPAVRTMFDVHNTAGETLPAPALIAKYIPFIRHVHLNEMDGRRPGTGSYDFRALFAALARYSYSGWLSLEVFDFQPSGKVVASEALRYLRSQIPAGFAQRNLQPGQPASTVFLDW